MRSSNRFFRFRFLCREDTVHKNIATIWDVLHKPWDLIKVKLSSSWFLNDEIRHSCLRNLTNWVFLSLWWFWVQDHLNNAVLTLIKVKMSSIFSINRHIDEFAICFYFCKVEFTSMVPANLNFSVFCSKSAFGPKLKAGVDATILEGSYATT